MFWKIQEILYLIDTKIFQFDLLEAEKFGSENDNPSLKIFERKGWNFAVLLQMFPSASIASYNFSLSFAFAGIPPNIQNLDIIVQHKFKHFRDRVLKISVP